MRALTVEPGTSGSLRVDDVPDPEPAAAVNRPGEDVEVVITLDEGVA